MGPARLSSREAPLSFAQERLWFIDAGAPGSATYNVPLLFRWRGRVDVAALGAALSGLARRHEVLRTAYQVRDGRPVQVVGPDPAVPVEVMPGRPGDGELTGRAREPFDLAGGAPLRCVVWRCGGAEGDLVLLCTHHIAIDGWSLAPLLEELAAGYRAAAEPAGLAGLAEPAELDVQYGDFATWDREEFDRPGMAARLADRVDELLAVPGALALGGVRRPDTVTEGAREGGHHEFTVPGEVWAGVRALATAVRATPFVVLFAAYQAVLRRWVEQDEFLVGTVAANRPQARLERLVGFFVNTVPLRCRVPPGVTFRRLCDSVRAESFRGLTYQRIPFDRLTAAARARGATALATVAFALQNLPAPDHDAEPPWRGQPRLLPTGTAKYDLLLLLEEGPGGLSGFVEHALDCYPTEVATTLATNFVTLLAAAVADPDRPVRELPITVREPGAPPPTVLSGPSREPPAGVETVLDAFEATLAAADPRAVAIECGGAAMTWGELDRLAWAVAGRVPATGFLPVIAARGGPMIAGWLGAMRSGVAYVPLSVGSPPRRAEHILRETGAGAVLADGAGAALVAGLGLDLDVIRLDRLSATVDPPRTGARPRPDSPAFVIYTSGTTGRPKGVLVAHRGLLNTVLWWRDELGLHAGDRVLNTWSTQFDAGTFDTYRCLATGCRLVLADDVERRDPRALLRLLHGAGRGYGASRGSCPDGATVSSMTPSLLRAMLDADTGPGRPPHLRAITLGGEAVTRTLVADCVDRWGAAVHNIYGPAEVSCVGTAGWMDPADARPPIGLPLPGTRCYILGRDLEELPAGVPGELFLAGIGVGLGYLAQPARTAEGFLPDPFEPGQRCYRTGDRVAVRPDGRLDFLGRFDDQVKILGNRIEPEEVRSLLEELPEVSAAAVCAEGEPPRLVAWVVLAGGHEPTRDELTEPLLRWLPPAVVPVQVYAVDAMPLSGNDKIDFGALGELRGRPLRGAAVEPVTLSADEQRAAELIAAAVGTGTAADLRPESNFFAVGGHSLLAVEMISAAERQLGVSVPLREFLAEPTVTGLARLLAAGRAAGGPGQPGAGGQREPDRFPASPVQQRLWFLDRVSGIRTAYLVPTIVELAGPVDRDRLREAVDTVLARHPALRTRFELDRGRRRVYCRTDGPPATVEPAAPGTDLAALCWTPFDLAAEAPVRARILGESERTLLVLVSHHAVIDGWSLRVLLDQIAAGYRDGAAAELAEPVHPARFAERPAGAADVIARLRGAPADVALPLDRPRRGLQPVDATTATRRLGPDLVARLRAVTAELGCSTFVAAAALLAATLARRGPQRDFLFAFPWAGREAPDAAHAVGMFVKTLVLRVDVRGEPSWRELLARVREDAKAAYRGADVAFDEVVAALHPDRDLSRPPLTPVFIGTFDAPMTAPDLGPGITARFRPLDPLKVKYELDLTVTDVGPDVELTATYPTALFDAATVAGLLAGMAVAAADLAADPAGLADKENRRARP